MKEETASNQKNRVSSVLFRTVVLSFLFVSGGARGGDCLGTIRDLASKLSKPEKVSEDFKQFAMEIHAKGDWKRRDIIGGTFAWNSKNQKGTITYELAGVSAECIDAISVIVAIDGIDDAPNAIAAMILVARVAGMDKSLAGEMSEKLMGDLPTDQHEITRKSGGYEAILEEALRGVFIYTVKKE